MSRLPYLPDKAGDVPGDIRTSLRVEGLRDRAGAA